MKILVYSMGEVIGDGLIKLPFAAGLRAAFPDAHIAWAAAKGDTVYATSLKNVVEGLIDEIVTATPTGVGTMDWLPWVKPFGGAAFDLVIDTQENLRRSAVAKRAVSKGGRFVSPSQLRGDWPEALTDRMAALLALAAPGAKPTPVRLADPALAAEAERLLPEGQRYVGFAPGSGGASKRWPIEYYIALATSQADRGRTPVFFLGPQELDDKAVIEASLPNSLFPEQEALAAFRGPRLVIALASRLAAAVANDAGPGHMLAAGGAPLLSLQRNGRKAVKFKPAAARLEMLVAEDYGEEMASIPVEAAMLALEKLGSMPILAPISAGELVDKITILRVKAERIAPEKQANVKYELTLLEALAERELPRTAEITLLTDELTAVNAALWDIEEGKRDCERRGDFGPGFVALARTVYVENDRRAAIKRAINLAAGSDLVEEKSYAPYRPGEA